MIVISGALVLVALVLLVLGLTMTELDFVYGSIGVSLVSFVFLIIGILQRRGEPAAAPAVTADDSTREAAPAVREDTAPAVAPVAPRTAAVPVPAGDDEDDDEEFEPGGGPVLIVAGRPRYHVEGCRYLTGKSPEEIDVLDARDDGFTPCGVCKPDEVLEELYGELVYEDDDAPPVEDDVEDTGVPGAGDDESAPAAARSRRGSTVVGASAFELGGSTSTRSRTAAPAAKAARTKAPTVAPTAVPAAPATPATAGAARTKVVVIPDRDRFHVPSCRFVRDALGTEELTRAQATRQGYRACGVCKP